MTVYIGYPQYKSVSDQRQKGLTLTLITDTYLR